MDEKYYSILIADDEKEIVEILGLYLENAGLKVIEAFDGPEALAAVEKENARIDIALVDIMMPKMDGYTLVKKIREHHNNRRLQQGIG
jgi:CheY-like chemotaxis protein